VGSSWVLRRPIEATRLTGHARNFLTFQFVASFVRNPHWQFGAPEAVILFGASVFISVLGVSAFWEPNIRWLHFFQSWMYLATIALSLRCNRWGYFIGISAAGLWDYMNIFATTFFYNGLQQLAQWFHTGHLARPDLLIAIPAWFSNLLVVIGCLWAYALRSSKNPRDAAKFVLSFALTTGFFALAIALFQSRYLGIFPRLLHPHLP
jgi:hypothetical protein